MFLSDCSVLAETPMLTGCLFISLESLPHTSYHGTTERSQSVSGGVGGWSLSGVEDSEQTATTNPSDDIARRDSGEKHP
jgi:hypothetical protein